MVAVRHASHGYTNISPRSRCMKWRQAPWLMVSVERSPCNAITGMRKQRGRLIHVFPRLRITRPRPSIRLRGSVFRRHIPNRSGSNQMASVRALRMDQRPPGQELRWIPSGVYEPESASTGTGRCRCTVPPLDSIPFIFVRRVHGEKSACFAGLDWATQTHHVCVVSDDGLKREERTFRHGGKELGKMAEWIAAIGVVMPPGSPSPSRSRTDPWSRA